MSEKEELIVNNEIYEKMAERLQAEKTRLERQMRQEYRSARKYVRSHPEEGIGFAFASGIIAGIILTKLFSK